MGLPAPVRAVRIDPLDLDLDRERGYDRRMLQNIVDENEPILNHGQRQILDRILVLSDEGQGGTAFIDAPGRTGKTFLLECIAAKLRLAGKIVLNVASSRIASTMLTGGMTAHKMFKIPIELERDEDNVTRITKDSAAGRLLKRTHVILWDEISMAQKENMEAVQKTLRDCRDNGQTMGGVLTIFAGDFRQTLPVVPKGQLID